MTYVSQRKNMYIKRKKQENIHKVRLKNGYF